MAWSYFSFFYYFVLVLGNVSLEIYFVHRQVE